MKRVFYIVAAFCIFQFALSAQNRWQIMPNHSIVWTVGKNLPHEDHIEMSGEQVSTVLRYGVRQDSSFSLERSMVWPMLRTIPNNTHASLMRRFAIDYPSLLIVNGKSLQDERVKSLCLDGKLTVVSSFSIGRRPDGNVKEKETRPTIELTRIFFPSKDLPMLCERYIIKNTGKKSITVNVPEQKSVYHTDAAIGVNGSYTLVAALQNPGFTKLEPGQECRFDAYVQAYKNGENPSNPDMNTEEQKRDGFVHEVWSNLVFESPDSVLNTAFAFAKIRASESIYKTKGGYLHGPGGESYYAAIWANDQAEYINPFFPYLGYAVGNESAINAYRHFARFMQKRAKKLIIDLRQNSGGNSSFAVNILSMFIPDSIISDGKWRTRVHNAAYASWGANLEPQDTIGNESLSDYYENYLNIAKTPYSSDMNKTNKEMPRLIVPTLILTDYATNSS